MTVAVDINLNARENSACRATDINMMLMKSLSIKNVCVLVPSLFTQKNYLHPEALKSLTFRAAGGMFNPGTVPNPDKLEEFSEK